MKLRTSDTTEITCKSIFGGPKLVNGVMRDTLRIEVDPNLISFDNLKKLFTESGRNNGTLYSISDDGVESKIGDGYKIFVSISDEQRKISQEPGVLAPPEYEEIYIVTIAQQTYEESQLENSPAKEE